MIFVLMGVSGSGKTTVGQLLAIALQIPFFDADHFHPDANLQKMKEGIPLGDADRVPWLEKLSFLLKEKEHQGGCVLACSALKAVYRELLQKDLKEKIHWIHLAGTQDLILSRLSKRQDHFMPANLLQSQFEILEVPVNALSVSIEHHPEIIVQQILDHLEKHL